MVTVSHKGLVSRKDLNSARPAVFPARQAINSLIFFFLLSFYSKTDLSVRYSNKEQRQHLPAVCSPSCLS